MKFLNWDNQTLIVAESKDERSHTLSQTNQEAISREVGTLNLTTAKQQWLDRQLQKSKSHKK